MMTDDQRKELLGIAGENRSKAPRLDIPVIRVNGNTGEIRKIVRNDGNEEEQPLTKPLRVVILKKGRRSLKLFTKTDNLFSSEYETRAQLVNLFRRVGSTVTFVKAATAPEIRDEFPLIKTVESAYVLHDGELCRLEIKGASLTGYYDYQTKLKEDKVHGFEVDTVITTKSEAGQMGDYHFFAFDSEPLSAEFDTVREKLSEVTEKLKEIDTYNARKNAERLPDGLVAEEVQAPAMPDLDEEINPEDIPF